MEAIKIKYAYFLKILDTLNKAIVYEDGYYLDRADRLRVISEKTRINAFVVLSAATEALMLDIQNHPDQAALPDILRNIHNANRLASLA